MATTGNSAYKHKVLIVDDEALNIQFLETLLSEEINVIFATSGEDALAIVQANRPDMILLDIMMPGMDGYEVCKRLKGNPDTRDIPVIFVTAKDGPEEEARGLELGAIDYITKPFNPEAVKSKVRNNIIRIATPRPDLQQHHNKERREQRQNRRADDSSGKWKWLAAGAVILALIVVVVALVPADKLNLDALLKSTDQNQASDQAASPRPDAVAPPAATPDQATPAATASAPVANRSQPDATVRDRSSPMDLKWVESVDCPLVPEVKWWSFVSHRSIVRYVERNLKGDWEIYADKWQGRLAGIKDIYDRNSTAITNTGVQLSGPALAEYIEQMSTRVQAIACLQAEAERVAGKK